VTKAKATAADMNREVELAKARAKARPQEYGRAVDATGPQRSDSGAPNSCPDCKKGIIHYPNGEQYVCHHCHGTGRLILDPMKGSFTSPCPRCSVPLDDALVTVELTREEAEALCRMVQGHDDEPLRYDAELKLRASLERTGK
jgi:hypothetical protein